jgi:glutamyl-tRNA reductase
VACFLQNGRFGFHPRRGRDKEEGSMAIVITGLSHHTAPLGVRESVAFPREQLGRALVHLRAQPGVNECAILSTCNRVEIHADVDSGHENVPAAFLASFHQRPQEELAPHLYRHTGEPAVRHAFEVAASLDSMVPGEAQILGQVKKAYEAAEEVGTLGPVLRSLRAKTFATAKRVRTETSIGQNAVSVSQVAVELARKIFGSLDGRSVLIVGAGKMSELSARQLVAAGAQATVLAGRSIDRAEALARSLGGRAVPFHCLRDELSRADVVISSTGAPGFVITPADVAAGLGQRGNRPLFLIDIAAPRDVDPAVRALESVFLYDLDDLKSVADANLKTRTAQLAPAASIVGDEVRAFLAEQKSRHAVPLLVALRRQADDVRRKELERARARLGPLTLDQQQAVEGVAAAIVNKLLHAPTVFLKQAAQDESAEQLSLASRILGLEALQLSTER